MGYRSISDKLSIENYTSTNYLTAKAEMEDAGKMAKHPRDEKEALNF